MLTAAAVRVAELGYARFFHTLRLQEGSGEHRVHEIEIGTGPDEGTALVASCGAGATATLLALADGRVYGWGTELAGELLGATIATTNESSRSSSSSGGGGDSKRHDVSSPALLPLPAPLLSGARRVRAMACGPHHVLMALAGGGVWAWGLDVNGQTLGLGACGRRLCLACAGEEEAASAAAAAVIVPAPRQVAGLEGMEVKELAAGENHALAVAADGRGVWAWGCGSSGQLGVGRRRPRTGEAVAEDGEVCSCRPLPLDISSSNTAIIENAAVGKRHSLLLTRGGQVWTFGSGLYHALGHGRTDNEWAPRRVAALEGIGEMRPEGRFLGGMAAVACGAWHSLALARSGEVYGWGWNRHGQLGEGGGVSAAGATLVPIPRLLRVGHDDDNDDEGEDVEFEQIGAGVHYSAGLGRDGWLYVWGTLGLAHDDAAAAAASSSPTKEAQQQRQRQPQSWDMAGPLQLQQAAKASVGLACGPYHLAVLAAADARNKRDPKSINQK